MRKITMWARKNEDKQSKSFGEYEHNHIEDGHVLTIYPAPKAEVHVKPWKRGDWLPTHAFLTNDSPPKVIYDIQ